MDAAPFPARWKTRSHVRAVRMAGLGAGTGTWRALGAGPAGLGSRNTSIRACPTRRHRRQKWRPGTGAASTDWAVRKRSRGNRRARSRCTSGVVRMQHSRWKVPLSSGPETVQLRLQFPDPPLCLQSSLPFRLGDALHCGQVHDGPAGLGVVPLQLSPLPAQVQLQHFAVALQTAVGQLHNFDRLVAVSDPPRAVARAGLVEAPVLRDAQGIVGGFIADV